MNPIYSSLRRQTQTLRCCRRLYRRWRFVGGRFNKRHVKRCTQCGARLNWPANHHPRDRKAVDRERQLIRRINFYLRGLNCAGRPRVKAILKPDERARRNREKYHWLAKQRFAKGLTSRGTKRILRPRVSIKERRWRDERAAMNIFRPEILPPLEREEAA